jgi:hypothetical protein
MTAKLTRVPTWLPVFSGFCNTVWEIDSNIIIVDPPCEDGLSELEWCRFGDARGYSIALAKKCCEVLQGWLPKESGITDFDFEEIQSPLEYNFYNDAIDIQVTVDLETFLPWIKKFIADNKAAWAEYLLRYRSRDGFISFYSHDPADWAAALDDADTLGLANGWGHICNGDQPECCKSPPFGAINVDAYSWEESHFGAKFPHPAPGLRQHPGKFDQQRAADYPTFLDLNSVLCPVPPVVLVFATDARFTRWRRFAAERRYQQPWAEKCRTIL